MVLVVIRMVSMAQPFGTENSRRSSVDVGSSFPNLPAFGSKVTL